MWSSYPSVPFQGPTSGSFSWYFQQYGALAPHVELDPLSQDDNGKWKFDNYIKNTKSEKQIKGLSFDYCHEDTFVWLKIMKTPPKLDDWILESTQTWYPGFTLDPVTVTNPRRITYLPSTPTWRRHSSASHTCASKGKAWQEMWASTGHAAWQDVCKIFSKLVIGCLAEGWVYSLINLTIWWAWGTPTDNCLKKVQSDIQSESKIMCPICHFGGSSRLVLCELWNFDQTVFTAAYPCCG